MVNESTVQWVRDARLCTGCGVCAGTCPIQAISMVVTEGGTYAPEIAPDRCDDCGACLEVCPGYAVDFAGLERRTLSDAPCSDALLGRYQTIFAGHARDEDVRLGASSGGVVTSVLVHALESSSIVGAVVTRASQGNPLQAHPCMATSVEDVIQAKGSKYCPVPVGISLREVARRPGRFAFVGLPCHIQGLRKAQEKYRDLYERIPLAVGLFCSRVPTMQGSRFMLEHFRIDIAAVKSLTCRGQGWPGSVRVETIGGDLVALGAFSEVWGAFFGHDHFTPSRCLLCADPLAMLADVSCGDPWLPEYRGDRQGTSLVIPRTKTGLEMIRQAEGAHRIALTGMSRDRAIASQASGIRRKRQNLKARFWFAGKVLGQRLPVYVDAELHTPAPTRAAYLFGWLPYFSMFIGRHAFLRGIWWRLPSLIRRAYARVYARVV